MLVFALVYHQINNFDDERVELVGGKKYGQVDALIAQRLGGKRFGRSRGPAQNTLAPQPTRANTQSIKGIFIIFSRGYSDKTFREKNNEYYQLVGSSF